MTAETFDRNTIWNKRGKPPVVRIESGKTARINFSVEAVKLLGLKEGMKIAFKIYHNDKGIIYFFEQATGIPMVIEKNRVKNGQRLAVYCRPLAEKILLHLGYGKDNKKTFDVSKEKVLMPDTRCMAWFIQKDKLHKPIKWRKHATEKTIS